MTITAAMERDPSFRLSSWMVKTIYPQLRGMRRIEAPAGVELVDALCVTLKGLSLAPREDVAAALVEMRARGLLVELDGGALAPKHAPKPRVELAPARPRARSATEALPDDADTKVRRAFAVHLSREHKDHPARKDPDPGAWPRAVQQLWHAYVDRYNSRPARRRATDPVTPGAPAVTPAPTSEPPAPVTGSAAVTPGAATASVTAVSEEVGGEKDSLSPSGEETTKTSQPPREGGGAPVTPAVTSGAVTADVTAPPGPPGPPGPPRLTISQLKTAVRNTETRVGWSGRADRQRVLEILNDEDVTRVELLALSRLARARRLHLQEKHERVSLHFLLVSDAWLLHRWIDDTRAELGKQPALGFAENDARVGATQAAPPVAGPTSAATATPARTIAEMPPEERAAALANLKNGIRRAVPVHDTPAGATGTAGPRERPG